MLFVAPEFATFFLMVLPLAWLARPRIGLWKVLMIASGLVFYGWWRHNGPNGTSSVTDRTIDWWLWQSIPGRFCVYLLVFAVVNWLLARTAASMRARGVDSRPAVIAACAFDLGVLFWFKYAQWTADLANTHLGTHLTVDVLLPLGISFISFQALGYVIDVHRGTQTPVTLSEFTSYLLFFPHIVAGPLVRVGEFLPQIREPFDPRRVEVPRALLLIASGFVKKVIISSYVFKHIVEPVFNNPKAFGGLDSLFASYGYAAQIYCDFSGYTDIAIGLALLLGIRFPQNFNNPYRATTIQDFWRRWHMSLSRWLRDYLYIGLGGNRRGEARTYVNLFLTMLIGGLWHGADFAFLIWGAIHGVALAVERYLIGRSPRPMGPVGPVLRWFVTFHIVCLGWVFFKAGTDHNTHSAWVILGNIARLLVGSTGPSSQYLTLGVLVAIAVVLAWQFIPDGVGAQLTLRFATLPAVAQGIAVGMVMVVCYFFGSVAEFIYFQF